jgi:hypothetical protein
MAAGERRSHFEVHIFADERWLLDGIFFERQDAIEDARALLGSRTAFDAVRVLQVEADEEGGFIEWTIFVQARPLAAGRQRHIEASWLLDRAALRRPAPMRGEPAAAPPPPRVSTPLLFAAFLGLIALMIVGSYRPAKNEVWVFDRPEAWQPHQVRSPWALIKNKHGENWGE